MLGKRKIIEVFEALNCCKKKLKTEPFFNHKNLDLNTPKVEILEQITEIFKKQNEEDFKIEDSQNFKRKFTSNTKIEPSLQKNPEAIINQNLTTKTETLLQKTVSNEIDENVNKNNNMPIKRITLGGPGKNLTTETDPLTKNTTLNQIETNIDDNSANITRLQNVNKDYDMALQKDPVYEAGIFIDNLTRKLAARYPNENFDLVPSLEMKYLWQRINCNKLLPKNKTSKKRRTILPVDLDKYFNQSNLNKNVLVSLRNSHMCFRVTMKCISTPNMSHKKGRKSEIPDDEAKDNQVIRKYYYNRYNLFGQYDLGIQLDEESWFSVTPEKIAEYTAKKLFECSPGATIIDGFSGVGGNTIQFAKQFNKVNTIEIDEEKQVMQKNNSDIYKVSEKINQINSDFLLVKNDDIKRESPENDDTIVFSSPPWGGVDYQNMNFYSIFQEVYPNIIYILDKSFELGKLSKTKICFMLPKNTRLNELVVLCNRAREKYGFSDTLNFCTIEKITTYKNFLLYSFSTIFLLKCFFFILNEKIQQKVFTIISSVFK